MATDAHAVQYLSHLLRNSAHKKSYISLVSLKGWLCWLWCLAYFPITRKRNHDKLPCELAINKPPLVPCKNNKPIFLSQKFLLSSKIQSISGSTLKSQRSKNLWKQFFVWCFSSVKANIQIKEIQRKEVTDSYTSVKVNKSWHAPCALNVQPFILGSKHAQENVHYPLWNNAKFINQEPHWYNQRVRQAIHLTTWTVEFPLSLVKRTTMGPTSDQINGWLK